MDLQRTAFDGAQRRAGASWTDWEGWAWAADFGDPVAEHTATRTACNIWDESPLRKWELRGPDALALADVLYTNDMASLEVGQVRYGALCDEAGKMVMDGTVFHMAENRCLSITSYDSDLEWFRAVASDRRLDVEVEDRTAQMPHLQVQGRRQGRSSRRSPQAPMCTRCATSGSSSTGSRSVASRAGSRVRGTPVSSVLSSTAASTMPTPSGAQWLRPDGHTG